MSSIIIPNWLKGFLIALMPSSFIIISGFLVKNRNDIIADTLFKYLMFPSSILFVLLSIAVGYFSNIIEINDTANKMMKTAE